MQKNIDRVIDVASKSTNVISDIFGIASSVLSIIRWFLILCSTLIILWVGNTIYDHFDSNEMVNAKQTQITDTKSNRLETIKDTGNDNGSN